MLPQSPSKEGPFNWGVINCGVKRAWWEVPYAQVKAVCQGRPSNDSSEEVHFDGAVIIFQFI